MQRNPARAPRQSGRGRTLLIGVAIAAASTVGIAPAPAEAQAGEPSEAVMVAAGQWVAQRVPGGVARMDPHRSGAGIDGARLERVARALGASLVKLEDVRRCTDVMDPSTCQFDGGPLVAIAIPQVDGARATVKVYCWHRDDSPRRPVAERTWDLVLQQSGGEWRVVSGGE